MDVSNKTYHIKGDPYYEVGERIVGDFTSAGHGFHEISIDEYEGDLEIWYIDRNDPSGSVLAYANGTWEIEYRYLTFGDGVELSDADYRTLTWAYDEYIEPKKLYITVNGVRKLGRINGKIKGSFTYMGVAYPFDNTPEPEPTGETWVINETISGVFERIQINFISNNNEYDAISLEVIGLTYRQGQASSIAYDAIMQEWTNQAYRTVHFETAPTGDLLTWLQANAVKQ